MEEKRVVLYMHGGSGNHGCEAIVNSTCHLVKAPLLVLSNSAAEDEKYSLKGLCGLLQERRIEEHRLAHVLYYGWRKLSGDRESYLRYRFGSAQSKGFSPLYVSIGGDNYCYEPLVEELMLANRLLHKRGARTVLWGCSIEPALLEREDVRADMRLYDKIIARESLTAQALRAAGIEKNVSQYPDPAFCLEPEYLPLPEGFDPKNTVGINLSPMVIRQETKPGVTLAAYTALVRHILDTTDLHVALIPHVVWKNDDDRGPLGELYEVYRDTGRVMLLPDASAPQLKGWIARCRLFIGARTHATIAAYSSQVPTLVIGYSVKARGIARDLFGTSNGYVKPVQSLQSPQELIEAFQWLLAGEEEQRGRLRETMPAYLERARAAGAEIDRLWEDR